MRLSLPDRAAARLDDARILPAARLLVQGTGLADVMPQLLGELAVGLVDALLGYLLFAIFEVEAKKRGTPEVF